MVEDAPLPLKIRATTGLVLAVLFLGLEGCARTAPELPDAIPTSGPAATELPAGSVDCAALDRELETLDAEASSLELTIKADRGRNQAVGYFGSLFVLPLIAAKGHAVEKARLDDIQVRRDELYASKKLATCPTRSL